MTTSPTTLQIVREWLRANGYDGLCNGEAECGCSVEHLAPCDNMAEDCQAARRQGDEFVPEPGCSTGEENE